MAPGEDDMARTKVDWRSLKTELEVETRKLFKVCPDEIKRFHYGLITHSDAGKYALNQYFGHWVHAYAFYMLYSSDVMDTIRHMARHPAYDVTQLKLLFSDIWKPNGLPNLMVEYGGQALIGKYIDKTIAALDTVNTKEEFLELLGAFQPFATRLYWWFHWYFPWGIGPAVIHRLEPEDVAEIVRLSKTTKPAKHRTVKKAPGVKK
jgi:hypothetical protein